MTNRGLELVAPIGVGSQLASEGHEAGRRLQMHHLQPEPLRVLDRLLVQRLGYIEIGPVQREQHVGLGQRQPWKGILPRLPKAPGLFDEVESGLGVPGPGLNRHPQAQEEWPEQRKRC